MELSDVPINTTIDEESNNNSASTRLNGEEPTQKNKDPESNLINKKQSRNLMPAFLEIKRFKNKYMRRSIHSLMFISFFLVLVFINFVGIELFFSFFQSGAQTAAKFEIFPKTGPQDSDLIHINKNNLEKITEDMKQYFSRQRTICETNHKMLCSVIDEIQNSECSEKYSFGQRYGEPCVLVELAPVAKLVKSNMTADNSRIQLKCDGVNNADKENVGRIEYYPRNGLPTEFWKNEKNSSPPFLMVRFMRPTPGVIFRVKCNVFWSSAKEMVVSDQSFHFEVLVDI